MNLFGRWRCTICTKCRLICMQLLPRHKHILMLPKIFASPFPKTPRQGHQDSESSLSEVVCVPTGVPNGDSVSTDSLGASLVWGGVCVAAEKSSYDYHGPREMATMVIDHKLSSGNGWPMRSVTEPACWLASALRLQSCLRKPLTFHILFPFITLAAPSLLHLLAIA
jgi:hypothetical protein